MISAYFQRVHVPGDNDIGGDNGDYISNSNQRRFDNEFMSEDLFDYDNRLRFFKINRMLLDFTNPDRDHNAERLRIGVSHAPLLIGGGPLLRAVISDLDPHIIFSGHWHESRIFVYPSTKAINFYENAVRHFDLQELKEKEHSYLEIMVPTCSYRMGKTKIGMGYAVLGECSVKDNHVESSNHLSLSFRKLQPELHRAVASQSLYPALCLCLLGPLCALRRHCLQNDDSLPIPSGQTAGNL